MHCGANPTARDGRIAGTMMPGDQQQDAIAAGDCLLKRAIDRRPRRIQIHAMEVEHTIRLDRAAAQALVPATVQRPLADRPCP
jgi:hypothetical protein